MSQLMMMGAGKQAVPASGGAAIADDASYSAMSGSGTSWTATINSAGPFTLIHVVADNTALTISNAVLSSYGAYDYLLSPSVANHLNSVAIFDSAISGETLTLTLSGTPAITPEIRVMSISGIASSTPSSSVSQGYPAGTTAFSSLNNPADAEGLMVALLFGRSTPTTISFDEGSILGTAIQTPAAGFATVAYLQGQHTGGDGAWSYTAGSNTFGSAIGLSLT